MNLLLKYVDGYLNLDFSNILIIAGGSSSGKSTLYNYIISGIEGKLSSSFLINGREIRKNEFSFLNISLSNLLDEEFKLTSKTYLYSRMNTLLKCFETSYLENNFNFFCDNIFFELKEEIFNDLDISINLDIEKIIFMITKNIVYKFGDVCIENLSLNEKFKIQYKMYLNRLLSINDNTFLIIDDFDSFGGIKNSISSLEYITKRILGYKTKVIIFLRNEELVNELLNLDYNIYFLKDSKVFKMPDFKNFVDFDFSYSEELFEKEVKKIRKENQRKMVYKFME